MFPSTLYPSYALLPRYWFFRDEEKENAYLRSSENNPTIERLLFHVNQDDYFSTLATILRFYEESLYDTNITPEMRNLQLKTIKDVMNNLLYLNKNYIIVPKNKTEQL
jgi:hypothetical protein